MKNNNPGSPRPLNWKAPQLSEGPVAKSTPHVAISDAHARNGSPPTRRGASALTIPAPAEINPELYLGDMSKALLQGPVDAPDPEEAVDSEQASSVAVGKRGELAA